MISPIFSHTKILLRTVLAHGYYVCLDMIDMLSVDCSKFSFGMLHYTHDYDDMLSITDVCICIAVDGMFNESQWHMQLFIHNIIIICKRSMGN